MKHPTALFIAGLPGSGKTYQAVQVAKAVHADHINSDQVRADLDLMGQYREADKQAVYQQMVTQMKAALKQGRSVVVDSTFYLQSVREHFRAAAQLYTPRVFWVFTSAEESTILNRIADKRPDSEADQEVYFLIKRLFEPIQWDYLNLQTDRLSHEERLSRILKYCDWKNDES